tara:strand:- start:57 stop:422 length:366 start_codon:yes stop_codon:yes gene_type:complete
LKSKTDPSLDGLFRAISFQIAGIAISLLANSANFALILFADTRGHEMALCVPIIATALFTFVWGDATLQSQAANIKDASVETRDSHAYRFISKQPYNLLRLMNFVLAAALAASQFSILFSE